MSLITSMYIAFVRAPEIPEFTYKKLNSIKHTRSNEEIKDIWNIEVPSETEWLQLDNNGVEQIPFGYFVNLPQLAFLDMKSNEINSIAEFSLVELGNLLWLDFYSNRLEVISTNTLKGLYRLQVLLLNSNHIHTLHLGCFSDLIRLKRIWLQDNELKVIPEGIFYPNHLPEKIYDLYIGNNPLQCDCKISWMVNGEGTWITITDKHKTKCAEPEGLANIYWNKLDLGIMLQNKSNCNSEYSKSFLHNKL